MEPTTQQAMFEETRLLKYADLISARRKEANGVSVQPAVHPCEVS